MRHRVKGQFTHTASGWTLDRLLSSSSHPKHFRVSLGTPTKPLCIIKYHRGWSRAHLAVKESCLCKSSWPFTMDLYGAWQAVWIRHSCVAQSHAYTSVSLEKERLVHCPYDLFQHPPQLGWAISRCEPQSWLCFAIIALCLEWGSVPDSPFLAKSC